VYLAFAILGAEPPATADHEEEVQRLVRDAREGSRAAARRLYALHVSQVFRAVRPLCASEAEAEDVVQETFIRVLGALGRYRRRPGARFISWVLTIALNLARKGLRRRGREVPLGPGHREGDLHEGADHDPAGEAMDLRLRKEALLAALAELPERQRQVITLRYGAGLTSAEVGEVAGVSEANVRKICQRQRAHLLERIKKMLRPPRRGRAHGPTRGDPS
jgi:RNA polymerase sigma-70 factor, ECF subfamily